MKETTAPSATYLRKLILALLGDVPVSQAIRNECHRLLFAINANDRTRIMGSFERLQCLADAEDFRLPSPTDVIDPRD